MSMSHGKAVTVSDLETCRVKLNSTLTKDNLFKPVFDIPMEDLLTRCEVIVELEKLRGTQREVIDQLSFARHNNPNIDDTLEKAIIYTRACWRHITKMLVVVGEIQLAQYQYAMANEENEDKDFFTKLGITRSQAAAVASDAKKGKALEKSINQHMADYLVLLTALKNAITVPSNVDLITRSQLFEASETVTADGILDAKTVAGAPGVSAPTPQNTAASSKIGVFANSSGLAASQSDAKVNVAAKNDLAPGL